MSNPRAKRTLALSAVAIVAVSLIGMVTSSSAKEGEGQLDAGIVANLARNGDSITPSSESSAISAEEAAKVAGARFEGIAMGEPTTSLVRFTDEGYGPVDEITDELARAYVDQLAWAVVYRGVPVPILGPMGSTGGYTYDSDFVVFVDANTGEVLLAKALASSGSVVGDLPGSPE